MAEKPKSTTVRATNETLLGKVTNLFTNKATTGQSAAKQPICSKWIVTIRGITTGTVKVQGSIDGTNWFDLATKTADGVHSNSDPWPYVRLDCTIATTVALYCDLVE